MTARDTVEAPGAWVAEAAQAAEWHSTDLQAQNITRKANPMPLQLAFDDTGTGPPVLILHGLLGSSSNWRSVARALAPQHRVLSVDLRNHGASPWADSMAYADMVADVLALMQAQGLQQPVLVGHSMGGKTAMALALLQPSAISGLVVVDIAPVAYADRMTHYVQAMGGIDTAALASRTAAQSLLAALVPDPGVVGFLLQNLVSRNDHFDWRLNLAAIGMAVPQLSGFPPELLGRRYSGRATLIYGTRSDYVSPADAARFVALFPKAHLQPIEGAGHWVHADKPVEFIAALKQAVAAA